IHAPVGRKTPLTYGDLEVPQAAGPTTAPAATTTCGTTWTRGQGSSGKRRWKPCRLLAVSGRQEEGQGRCRASWGAFRQEPASCQGEHKTQLSKPGQAGSYEEGGQDPSQEGAGKEASLVQSCSSPDQQSYNKGMRRLLLILGIAVAMINTPLLAQIRGGRSG